MAILFAVSSELLIGSMLSETDNNILTVWLFTISVTSLAIAMPIVSLVVFGTVINQVTGKFADMTME